MVSVSQRGVSEGQLTPFRLPAMDPGKGLEGIRFPRLAFAVLRAPDGWFGSHRTMHGAFQLLRGRLSFGKPEGHIQTITILRRRQQVGNARAARPQAQAQLALTDHEAL